MESSECRSRVRREASDDPGREIMWAVLSDLPDALKGGQWTVLPTSATSCTTLYGAFTEREDADLTAELQTAKTRLCNVAKVYLELKTHKMISGAQGTRAQLLNLS